jgi:hypothetical protein
MASASATGGSGGSGDDLSYGCVHRAAAAGKSAEEVSRLIELCAQGDKKRRAVNETGRNNSESPLQAAHRLQRGDLVGALLEAGADVSALSPFATPLVLCIAYGLADSLRVLLKAGHDANQRLYYSPLDSINPLMGLGSPYSCTAAHLCVAPPRLSDDDNGIPPPYGGPAPQLSCLQALAQEGKADLDAVAGYKHTPLHWLAIHVPPGDAHLAALDLLVRLGADVDARSDLGETPLFMYAHNGYFAGLQRLLGHGATADCVEPKDSRLCLCLASTSTTTPPTAAPSRSSSCAPRPARRAAQ